MKPLRLSESEEAALNAVCPNLLNSKEARSNHPADRHRFRAKCLAESRRLLEASKGEGRAATRAELEAFDSITRLVDLVDLQNEADRHAQAEFNQEHGGDGRVFSNSAKVARTAPTGELAGLQVGDLMRAMVTGATSGEIRNVLAEGTDSAGGYTVPTVLVEQFIDRMRAASVCVTAGAKTVLLDTKQTSIARLETDPAPAWRAENAAVAESDPTFGTVPLTARSLAVLVKISRELLEDSINIGDILTGALANALALELDRVALLGSGTAPEPRGIFNTSGILSQSQGDNGAALTGFGPLVTAWGALAAENCAPNAMVMAPRTRTTLGGLLATDNQPLNPPPLIAGVPMLVTSQMPITQTQGTANNASSIIIGDFTRLLIGVRTGLRIELLKERYAENMQYAFVAHLRADIAVEQPKAFLKLIGVIP
ncbi:MAG: phage major capsid protein [Gammaproteobacteria bacterium]|nr:phage major capsid protein [Gammaproteobacteria bacterium]MBK8991271.1 phage major capsid protein [Gammaproteobacteria bacterium]MBK9467752.1 phage major capsid protein [Gammaproteobacteria bacterium]MBP7910069.1 phage major capsid protein [Pseudomonadales bacterium]